MIHLIYASAARKPVGNEILDIIRSAEGRNEGMGLSGMLIYGNQAYLQLIEGDPRPVMELYATIAQDPRHKICCVWRRPVEERSLNTSLPMGYKQADFPASYLFELNDVSGPMAIDYAVKEARLKYPNSSRIKSAGMPPHLVAVTQGMDNHDA